MGRKNGKQINQTKTGILNGTEKMGNKNGKQRIPSEKESSSKKKLGRKNGKQTVRSENRSAYKNGLGRKNGKQIDGKKPIILEK